MKRNAKMFASRRETLIVACTDDATYRSVMHVALPTGTMYSPQQVVGNHSIPTLGEDATEGDKVSTLLAHAMSTYESAPYADHMDHRPEERLLRAEELQSALLRSRLVASERDAINATQRAHIDAQLTAVRAQFAEDTGPTQKQLTFDNGPAVYPLSEQSDVGEMLARATYHVLFVPFSDGGRFDNDVSMFTVRVFDARMNSLPLSEPGGPHVGLTTKLDRVFEWLDSSDKATVSTYLVPMSHGMHAAH